MTFRSNIESKVFSRFKRIPEQAYHDYILFYKTYFNQIQQISFDEYIEIKFQYIKSLYHLDRTDSFFQQANELIMELMNHDKYDNIHRKMYQSILMIKSKLLINELRHAEARQVLQALYKINPENKEVKKLLFQQLFDEALHRHKKWLAIIVLLIICSLSATGIYFLFLRSFYPEWEKIASVMRNIAFGGSITLFGIFYLLIFKRVRQQLIGLSRKNTDN